MIARRRHFRDLHIVDELCLVSSRGDVDTLYPSNRLHRWLISFAVDLISAISRKYVANVVVVNQMNERYDRQTLNHNPAVKFYLPHIYLTEPSLDVVVIVCFWCEFLE